MIELLKSIFVKPKPLTPEPIPLKPGQKQFDLRHFAQFAEGMKSLQETWEAPLNKREGEDFSDC